MTDDQGVYRAYVAKKFRPAESEMIRRANVVLSEYEERGIVLSLRGLHYQFVARGWYPNTTASYDKLGDVVGDGRMAGLVSWTAIEDRLRSLQGIRTYTSPVGALRAAATSYRTDLWANQPYRPEVWFEKDAILGTIGPVCEELRVSYLCTRGYNSMSTMWRGAMRLERYVRDGQRPIVFHVADHDPSGVHMTEDVRSRLETFVGVPVMVVRLALNRDQVDRYEPPPNPAKLSDSRSASYLRDHPWADGNSWEVDALPPEVLADTIRDAVLKVRDEARWSDVLAVEAADRRHFDEIVADNEDSSP